MLITALKKYVLLCMSLLIISGCLPFLQRDSSVRSPVQVVNMQFPDGSSYFILYDIPWYFPEDIFYYRSGSVRKLLVYDEREMDLIIKTDDPLDMIVNYYIEQTLKNQWILDRSIPDNAAANRTIILPLIYKEQTLETLTIPSTRGHIIAAMKNGIVIVCRIIKESTTPLCTILQQMRYDKKR